MLCEINSIVLFVNCVCVVQHVNVRSLNLTAIDSKWRGSAWKSNQLQVRRDYTICPSSVTQNAKILSYHIEVNDINRVRWKTTSISSDFIRSRCMWKTTSIVVKTSKSIYLKTNPCLVKIMEVDRFVHHPVFQKYNCLDISGTTFT